MRFHITHAACGEVFPIKFLVICLKLNEKTELYAADNVVLSDFILLLPS